MINRGARRPSPQSPTLSVVMIGAGWISGYHLAALDRLGRTRLVGLASGHLAAAGAAAGPRGAAAYQGNDVERMLDEKRPDAAIVAVPPWAAVGVLEQLVARDIPFLTEKPLAAADAAAPARLAAQVAAHGLVAAAGYHLRGLPVVAELRAEFAVHPPHLVTARWLGDTPRPAWWRTAATGGGQVVEQATHFYDLARHLLGEATVIAATATRGQPAAPDGVDLADATAALLTFDNGAIGSFANSRRLASAVVEIEFACSNALFRLRKLPEAQTAWELVRDDDGAVRTASAGRDPYEVQAEAFLDAVEARDPGRVLSSYADALLTDRLTRAVVAAAHGA